MLCVSDKTVSHWQCDKTSLGISLLLTIADIFGITADELLKGERNTNAPIILTLTLTAPILKFSAKLMNELTFICNNLRIAYYNFDRKNFKVITHSQLIEAEKEADLEFSRLSTIHFIFYPVTLLFSLELYFILKRLSQRKKQTGKHTAEFF